jgi:heat shock protein HslJ
MKNIYILATVAFLALTSCEKKEKTESETSKDSIAVTDTTSVTTQIVATDSTTSMTDSSNVELLDKMSTKTTTITTDESKGKFALAETKWKLVELNGVAVKSATNKDYYINLDSKSGKFVAYAGCNNFAGTFVMKSAGMLMFSKIMGTKMACPNMDFENNFIKTIGMTSTYMIENGGKVLHLHNGKKMLAKFEAIK